MKLRGVAVFRMTAVSVISTINVDRPRARLSDAPMRVKMRSISGSSGRIGRHEGAHLGEDRDQRGLSKVGRFAAHIGPRDHGDQIRGVVQKKIVGDEASRLFPASFSITGWRPAMIRISSPGENEGRV